MCIENLGSKLIADKDIECWKFGSIAKDGVTFVSMVHSYPYTIKERHKVEVTIKDNKGFSGFHSYVNKDNLRYIRSFSIVRCTIPKGSAYYIGNITNISNEVVDNFISEELIVEEVVQL